MPVAESQGFRRDYPWFGSGLGSYPMAYYRYESGPSHGHKVHAHNDHAEFNDETGRIGAILLAVAVLSTYSVSLAALYYRHRSWNRGIAFAAVMAMTAVLIHSASDFNLQIPANALTLMALLGLGWIARYLPTTQGDAEAVPPAPMLSGNWSTLTALGMIAALVLVGYRSGEIGYSDSLVGDASEMLARAGHARASGTKKPLEVLDAGLQRALWYDPTNPRILRLIGQLYERKAAMAAAPGLSLQLRRDALRYQLASAEIRPVAPFIWADILSTKNRLGAYDTLFAKALENAALLAPWERTVQYLIADIGLASAWYRLAPNAQQLVIETIERGKVNQGPAISALITRHQRGWVVCAYAQSEMMSGYCRRLSSRGGAGSD